MGKSFCILISSDDVYEMRNNFLLVANKSLLKSAQGELSIHLYLYLMYDNWKLIYVCLWLCTSNSIQLGPNTCITVKLLNDFVLTVPYKNMVSEGCFVFKRFTAQFTVIKIIDFLILNHLVDLDIWVFFR